MTRRANDPWELEDDDPIGWREVAFIVLGGLFLVIVIWTFLTILTVAA